MADLSQGYSANVVLNAGDTLRVSTAGQATVESKYGAPAGTTTVNANSVSFGPYSAPAKLRVTAVSGSCSYWVPADLRTNVTQDNSTLQLYGAGGKEIAVGIGAVMAPPGFSYVPPFTVFRAGGGASSTFTTNYSSRSKRPTPDATVYVGLGGSNNNDGTTYATRVRSMSLAVLMANALAVGTVRILFEPGSYKMTNTQARSGQPTLNATYPDAWHTAYVNKPTCNLVIEPYDDGIGRFENVADKAGNAWTATNDANIYQQTYTGTASYQVIDNAVLTANGQPMGCFVVDTVADASNPWPEINAAWAKWGTAVIYVDTAGLKRYLRLSNNRAPDASVLNTDASIVPGMSAQATATTTIWMRNCTFRGGLHGFWTRGAVGFPANLYTEDCIVTHVCAAASLGGFIHNGGPGEHVHLRPIVEFSVADAFAAYGADSNEANCPTFSTLGAKTYQTGYLTALTQNGLTGHSACRLVDVGGVYLENLDRTVHNIGNTQSWLMGTKVSNRRGSTGGTTSAGFAVGQSGQSAPYARMWVDAVQVVPGANGLPQYPFESYTGANLYYANLGAVVPTVGDGTGSVAAYNA